MKRFIITMCTSVLFLAGGNGATASHNPQIITLSYGELARVGNTVEVCAAVRVSTWVGSAPSFTPYKQMAPALACYPSKKGPPVIGTHINQAMWVKGPNGEVALVPAIGQWIRWKGIKDPYLSITDLWLPEDWGVSNIRFDAIVFSKDQLQGKVKVKLKKGDGFVPQGVAGTSDEGPVCGFSGVAAGCHYQELAGAKKLLSITFWPPWGPRQVQVATSWLSLDCSQASGCPTALPLYPRP